MISYLVIVVMSLTMLYITTLTMTSKRIEEQAIEHNMTMIEKVSDGFYAKCKGMKNAISLLYTTSLTTNVKTDIWKLMRSEDDLNTIEYMNYRSTLVSYLRENCLALDNDLMLASVIKSDNNKVFTDSNIADFLDDTIRSAVLKDISENEEKQRIYYTSAFEGGYDKVVLMYYSLGNPDDISKTLGYMVFAYAPDSFKNIYNTYTSTKLGQILIISNQGEVLFDSEERYYGELYPDMKTIIELESGSERVDEGVMNVVHQEDYDFYVVSIIDNDELKVISNPIKTAALISGVLFLMFAALFAVLTSHSLTKRIKVLLKAMNIVKKGDLQARANLDGNDEIREIGDSFDEMCKSLENYIQREYIYQMRQKEAQVFALQNQVNPHFLYNALEAIRMKAVMANDTDVSKMVVCLANIFRNNIKSDMVISLRQEIANCRSFLEFYNLRYDYGIEIICNIDDANYRTGILRHMIQPILENSIVHGLDLNRQDNLIIIEAFRSGEYLIVQISDSGKGILPESLEKLNMKIDMGCEDVSFATKTDSIGIVNAHERIQLIYGKECGLSVESVVNQGTCVTMKIKNKTVEELKKDVQRADSR